MPFRGSGASVWPLGPSAAPESPGPVRGHPRSLRTGDGRATRVGGFPKGPPKGPKHPCATSVPTLCHLKTLEIRHS